MALDAPGEANAVRTDGSLGLSDGVASVRAAGDFQAFSRMAGYPRLAYDGSQETGASAATNSLVHQASGPRLSRGELLEHLSRGPVAMQFDRLAEGVVRNRLEEVAPAEGVDRRAMRAELIGTMLHPRWQELAQRSPDAGRQVADDIGRALNAKVDELRHRFQHPGSASDGVRQQNAERTPMQDTNAPRPQTNTPQQDAKQPEVTTARFLSGVAPATAVAGRRPSLGDGSRVASADRRTSPSRSRDASENTRR